MAKPRTAPSSAPKTAQGGKPTEALAVDSLAAGSIDARRVVTDPAAIDLMARRQGTVRDDSASPVPSADDAPRTWCFEVLTPFKFRGHVVKPPAWIEMTIAQAWEYQKAGVLGDVPAIPEALE